MSFQIYALGGLSMRLIRENEGEMVLSIKSTRVKERLIPKGS